MADKKVYTISINGITESVDAVESLLKKLETLEQRIDALSNKGVNINSSVGDGGSSKRVSDLTAEEKLAQQINASQEKRIALQTELGKQLADEKQAMKEINQEQKSLAAKERLSAGGYDSNTMLGMKSELADIKAAMQTMDIGSDEFLKATQRADELNSKLKELEYNYGQFGRNVGNYPTDIVDEIKGISIALGDQRVQFNSTKEALRTLREDVKSMAIQGKENTEEYKNATKALHDLEMGMQKANSAVNDLKYSSKGMDEAMDWMESFGAMSQLSNGFGAFFGHTNFEESIQKLMALQNVMKGLEKIRTQMNTGEGIGKWLSAANSGIDSMVSKMTGATKTMEGWTAATRTATVTARVFSTVLKGIAGLGIGFIISEAIGLIQQLASSFGSVKNSATDAVKGIDLFKSSIEQQNKQLENNIIAIKIREQSGEISKEESRRQQIEATTDALKKQYEQMMMIARLNDSDSVYKNFVEGTQKSNLINANELKEATELWNKYKIAVEAGRDIHSVMEKSADNFSSKVKNWAASIIETSGDTKEAFSTMTQSIIGQFTNMAMYVIQNYQNMADGGKSAVTQLINVMNDGGLINNILMNLPAYLGNAAEGMMPVINGIVNQIRSIGVSLGIPNAESTDDANARLKKELDKIKNSTVKAAKTTQKQTLDIEKETQKMKLDLMAEGYQKELTKLKQERDDMLRRYKGHNELILNAQQLYEKKSKELRVKYTKEAKQAYREMWKEIVSYSAQSTEKEIKNIETKIEKLPSILDKKRIRDFYAKDIFRDLSEDIKESLEMIKFYFRALDTNPDREGFGSFLEEIRKAYEESDKWNPVKKLFGQTAVDTFDDFLKVFRKFKGELEDYPVFRNNTVDITDYYRTLSERIEQYHKKLIVKQKELLNKQRNEELNQNKMWSEEQQTKTKETFGNMLQLVEENATKTKRIKAEEQDALNRIIDEAMKRQLAINTEYDSKLKELTKNLSEKRKEIIVNEYNELIQEYRDYYSQAEKTAQNAQKRNIWGFTDWKKYKGDTKEAIENLEYLEKHITALNREMNEQKDKFSTQDYKNISRDLLSELEQVINKIKELKQNVTTGKQIETFMQEFEVYFSAVSDSFQTIMSAFQENQDYELEKAAEALDKENEILQQKLEEQEEILDKHKDNVNKIEGQLTDARGDRKERLIDALNEEIIAQRRAQSEKESIEKEQQKIEERQEELEKKKREYEYQRGLQQILFQTSQAVMAAAVNAWPVPAIPLMALAAATGAVQYALARQRKPYAEGGIIDGISHSNGGVSVGDGVEVENGEFVVNRKQTERNVDLLNLINNSDRQLTTADLMNFATNMNISPLDANSIESTSLETAFVAYSQRPIWVSVQDINSTQESVRRVEVLSGMQK